MKSKSIALGGIMLALSMITLYAEAVFPAWELSLYALSSFYGAILIIESGIGAGWMFYGASLLLGLVLVPDKLAMIPYGICFGLYAVVKYYIEKLHRRPLEIALKLLFFNGTFAFIFFIAKETLFAGIEIEKGYMLYLLFAALQAAFIVYDFAFSSVIKYYVKRRR